MRNRMFILNKELEPISEPNPFKWGKWFEKEKGKRIVKQESVNGIKVSTVFLGLDHNWWGGPPVLWETMCFATDQRFDGECDRCSGSREQAIAMHEKMVKRIKNEAK